MTRAEFLASFEKMVNQTAGSLSGDESLRDLEEWDSVTVVEFMAFVDEQFSVQLDTNKLANCETVGDLLVLLDGLITPDGQEVT
jgi:acyl carrier protein